ncbi:MAG TPA: hypothetical protein VK680_14090 [Solirubrobacteraceae bacterium]|nr:hypothetical protein [Solirubrobacteraceae bacterium]
MHDVKEVARLKATQVQSPVYTDEGTVGGTIPMHMKLVFNDDTGQGSYTATASGGTIRGTVVVTSDTQGVAKGIAIYSLVGYGTVNGGTGIYRHSANPHMTMVAEIVTTESRFNMTLSGALLY